MSHSVDPLTRLAIRHGSDKWGPHFYTPVYHQLFSHLREGPVRLLEIGIGGYGWSTLGGASLAMWAEYFTNGHIVGVDIEEKRIDLGPRVTLRQGSQNDPTFLTQISEEYGPFDIVIDDGSHLPPHVVTSFEVLFPRISDGGLYVIEDVQTCFWPMFGGAPDGAETMKLATTLLSQLNHAEIRLCDPTAEFHPMAREVRSLRALHNLLIFEKGDNDDPSNFSYDLRNPRASRAVQTIEQELARSPTPEGFANLILMLFRGGAAARAQSMIREALARWPASSALLMAAIDVAVTPDERLAILDRLARLEPEGSGVVARARTAILDADKPFSAGVLASSSEP